MNVRKFGNELLTWNLGDKITQRYVVLFQNWYAFRYEYVFTLFSVHLTRSPYLTVFRIVFLNFGFEYVSCIQDQLALIAQLAKVAQSATPHEAP